MVYDVFSAFGNEVRARLLLCLAGKPKNVTELIKNCGLTQSAVSQHLGKLRSAGLVDARKNGKEVVYSLKYKKAAAVSRILLSLKRTVI